MCAHACVYARARVREWHRGAVCSLVSERKARIAASVEPLCSTIELVVVHYPIHPVDRSRARVGVLAIPTRLEVANKSGSVERDSRRLSVTNNENSSASP